MIARQLRLWLTRYVVLGYFLFEKRLTMPVVNAPIPEVDQLISRPVVYAVMEQIKKITNIPQSTEVTYVGQGGSRMQFENKTSPNEAPVKLASDRAIIVEVDEQPDESLFTTTVGNQVEQQPDFLDRNLGIEFKPSYCGFEYVVTVIYRTPSRSEAIRWRNDARYKASQMRMVNLHELEYQYQMPPQALELLQHLHTLREAKKGFNQTFEEYLTQGLTTRATQVSTVTGTYPELIIREKQFRVQGTFDFTHNPERQDKNEGNGWEVRFTYTFSFNKPTEYSLRYPIVVHNQPIDVRYVPMEVQDPTFANKRMALSINAIHYMEEPVALRRISGYEPIFRSPTFDGWIPDIEPPNQRLFATFLLGLEDQYSGAILNLNRLGDYFIDPDVMQWITAEEWRYLQLPHTSPIQVHLYRNESLSAPQAISVNAQGDVVLLEKADARKRYRVAISVAKKLQYCDARSLKRLTRYPDALCKIIRETKTTTGGLHAMLPHVDLNKFTHCAISAGMSREQAIDGIIGMRTVMRAAVLADRQDDPSALSPATQLKLLYPSL